MSRQGKPPVSSSGSNPPVSEDGRIFRMRPERPSGLPRVQARVEKGSQTRNSAFGDPDPPHAIRPWQCLYFRPLPQGQKSLRPTRSPVLTGATAGPASKSS